MLVILVLGKLRQDNYHKLEANLVLILNSRPPYLNTLSSHPKKSLVLLFFPGNRGRASLVLQSLGILPGYHCYEIH